MSDDRIRIMYVIGSLGNGLAGTERNLLTIIEHLDRDRFAPSLICLQDGGYIRRGDFPCPTECLHLYRMFTPKMFSIRKRLAKHMSDLKIDICQTFFVEGHLVGGGAARKAGIKAIISSRRNLGYSYNLKENIYLSIANHYPYRFLANSHAVADSISRIEGTPRERFDVIYNGVEITPEDFEALGTLGFENRSRTVVVIANLRPVKSVETLIEAAAVVVQNHPQSQFLIAGDGLERSMLQAMIDSHALQENVHLMGSVSDPRSIINRGSIGVLTSLSEGFSNSLLEYMRGGLAVIATDVGGNREIIHDGENGFLIPVRDPAALAEKLNLLLSDAHQSARLGMEGNARVREKFSLARMISDHEDYYAKLVSHRITSTD